MDHAAAFATSAAGRIIIAPARFPPSPSERYPTSGMLMRSPNMCPAKIDAAIAVARVSGGTAPSTTALKGDMETKIPSCASPIAPKKSHGALDGASSARNAAGTAAAVESAHTRIAAWVLSSPEARSAHAPPRNVPAKPVTTTRTPK
jgi:hypothetical protein